MSANQNLQPIRRIQRQFCHRERDGHKGTFGTVLILGGSRGMSGAPALAAMAALRCGAGLVRAAVPECVQPTVAALFPEYTTIPLPSGEMGTIANSAHDTIWEQIQTADVLAVGPGLGQSPALDGLIRELWISVPIPVIFDADALNALAKIENLQTLSPSGLRIITPHPGEFARLNPATPAKNRELQCSAAVEWAKTHHAIVVLKGAGTQTSDGFQTVVNTTGNPGMATGGSGDVLTGMTAAILVQCLKKGISPFDAVRFAVWLHGRAGDQAARSVGQTSLIASDILRAVPECLKSRNFFGF